MLLRYQAIDESSALANIVPKQFCDDQAHSLIRDLQHIDQESNQYLRSIAESNRDLELYLKLLSKKIDTIAANLVDSIAPAPDQQQKIISLSEGGLAFPSASEHAHDSYLALQLTLLPLHVSLILFAKVINCSANNTTTGKQGSDGFSVAVSIIHLKDSDRQIIAKHIIQLQQTERRSQKHEFN